MRMILASNNAHKAEELRAILSGLGVETLTMRESGFSSDPEENGTTFEENAYIKAKSLFDIAGCAVIADDSGLTVDALGGAPGVYSARYAGEHGAHIPATLCGSCTFCKPFCRSISVVYRTIVV